MIQVYTGNGKGKTTAAFGLTARALGAGFGVYIAQFVKAGNYSELKFFKNIKGVKIEQFGSGCFIKGKASKKDIALAQAGIKKAKKAISLKKYRVIILDEVNTALKLGLVGLEDVLNILKKAPKSKEIVLTGRCAHPLIVKCADLVSEIKEIKHYYSYGVKARKGIEY